MKKYLFLLPTLLLAMLIAACGSTPEPVEFTVEMSEYEFSPDTLEVEVGQEVTINLVNVGELDHEFMVGQVVANDDAGRPSGFRVDFFANAGVTPTVSGGGMLMDHSEEHDMDAMDDMDEHADEDMEDMDEHADGEEHAEDGMDEMDEMAVNMVMQPANSDPTTVTFTVTEEMLGEWEIGCFEEDGVHYTSGMIGTLIVRQ